MSGREIDFEQLKREEQAAFLGVAETLKVTISVVAALVDTLNAEDRQILREYPGLIVEILRQHSGAVYTARSVMAAAKDVSADGSQ